ncbi:uncharacterized protein ACIGJ3_022973 [Trichechus inunguis]
MKNFLEDLGIEITSKECLELAKCLQIDDDGNIYQSRLLDGVKSLKGGKVDVSKLENILENMEIKIPDKKVKDLSQNLPVDASGKTDLHKLLKEVKKFTGGKVEAKSLRKVLRSMGIELTNRELCELVKMLPVTDDGMVDKNTLFDFIKSFSGGQCYVSKLENVLENMGYDLEYEEVEYLRNCLPAEDDSKVKLSKLMENAESFSGVKFNADEVEDVLENMGVVLTPKERWELLRTLPITSDGKVYHNRLVDSLKTFHGGRIYENKLESILEKLNLELEKNEIKDLRNHLKTDSSGNVPLNSLMNLTKYFAGVKINASDVQFYLGNVGIELTSKESQNLLNTLPLNGSRRVFKNRLMDGVKNYKEGKVNMNKIDDALETMGFELEEEEIEELCDYLPVDGEYFKYHSAP